MNITIIGSGAMACLFAARLAKVTPVSLLGTWPVGLAAIQREGIWVNSITGNSNVRGTR
jgi:ketopantoate reductase